MNLSNKYQKARYYFLKEYKVIILTIIFGLLFNIGSIFGPIMLGKIVSSIASNDSAMQIIRVCISYLGIIIVIQTCRFFKRYFVRLFAIKTTKTMRKLMYHQVINQSINDLNKDSIGDLMNKGITDVDLAVEGFRKSLTEVFDTGVLMVSYFVTLLIYDYQLTLMACTFLPLSIVIAYLLRGNIYKTGRLFRSYASEVNESIYELIDNNNLFKNHGSLDEEIKRYDCRLQLLRQKALKANLLEGCMEPIYKALGSIGLILVVWFGAQNVIQGENKGGMLWDIGVFTAYTKIFMNFVNKSSKAAKLINTIQKSKVSFERISPYLGEVKDNNEASKINNLGTLAVNNLTFGYNHQSIIGPLSFHAHKGQIIGVTGAVASGKTTLGIALLGLYPYGGSILLNGKELNTYNQTERSTMISYLGHNPYLLSTSIINNIQLGRNIPIRDVIKDVSFINELEGMDLKENTLIGNQGIRLSGGQKQRIALGRALLAHNELIILDDPFSACDISTEKEIIKALRDHYQDSIIILISHRISAFSDVDSILMLDKTPVFNTHQYLMEHNQEYQAIYWRQGGDDHA